MQRAALEFDPHQRTAPADDRPCHLAKNHDPAPLVTQAHHTFPKYLQAIAFGVDESALEQDPRFDGSLVDVCGTHHDSIHAVIRRLLGGTELPKYRASAEVFNLALHAVERFNEVRRG